MRRVKNLVIGAGPSGLAVAYGLQGDTLIVEKASSPGGLCRSVYRDGGVFDIGGHSFHTPHPEVRELVEGLMGKQLYFQRRQARVYTHDTLIPYPFQKNYDSIPDARVVRECQEGLKVVAESGPPPSGGSMEDFIPARFGAGIANHFMLPYNRKIWARDLSRISAEWVSERVAAPKGTEEKFETSGGKRKPLQSDTLVGYPAEGGYQAIFDAFLPHVPAIELDTPIVRIDPVRKTARSGDGTVYEWSRLVTSMPLPELVRAVSGVPPDIAAGVDELEFVSMRIELLLVDRPLDTELQRIYVGDSDVPAHKIAINHNSSESLRRSPRHAVMAEVSHSDEKPVDFSQVAPKTIELLRKVGVLESPEEVVWVGHEDVKYGYPVKTFGWRQRVDEAKSWFRQRDIFTIGRFGEWEYINSDACVQRGLDLAREIGT